MDSSGDIYSKQKVEQASPWKGHRHRKSKLDDDSGRQNAASESADKSRHGSSRRRKLRRQRARRVLVSGLLLVLLLYMGYTGVIALRGALEYKGIDPSDISLKALFGSSEPEPDIEIGDGDDYQADSFPAKAVIERIEKGRSIEMDVRGLLDKGLAEQALERYLDAGDSIAPSESLIEMIAKANIAAGRYAEALGALRKSLELDPEDVELRIDLAEVLLKLGDFEASVTASEWALGAESDSVRARKVLAEGYTELGMSEQAVREFRRILTLKPGDDDALGSLALAYYKNGEYGRAVSILSEMIKRGTDSSPAYYNLAICYAKQSLVDETVEVLMKASRKFGNEFVRAWVQGEEFDVFEDSTKFIIFASNLERGPDVARIRARERSEAGKQLSIGTSPIKLDDRTDSLINR